MTITFVYCDDWEGLYIDGKRYDESHHVSRKKLFEIINDIIEEESRHRTYCTVCYFDFNEIEISQEYVEEHGLPLHFSDIPEEAFCK